MRESEVACRTSGVDVVRIKIALLLISSAIAGAAGSLLAGMNGFVSPPTFGWSTSIAVLMMVVLGGVRSLPGALVGATVIRLVLERTSVLGQHSNIVFGVALVLFMAFLPDGLAGLAHRLALLVLPASWRRAERAAA
jgi:branched-chain amino acid transport system permease protein